ncbi:hypothetical protein ACLOJK_033307 [Asimina triloba]
MVEIFFQILRLGKTLCRGSATYSIGNWNIDELRITNTVLTRANHPFNIRFKTGRRQLQGIVRCSHVGLKIGNCKARLFSSLLAVDPRKRPLRPAATPQNPEETPNHHFPFRAWKRSLVRVVFFKVIILEAFIQTARERHFCVNVCNALRTENWIGNGGRIVVAMRLGLVAGALLDGRGKGSGIESIASSAVAEVAAEDSFSLLHLWSAALCSRPDLPLHWARRFRH